MAGSPAPKELLDRLKRRDAGAVDLVAATHARRLYRAARGMGFGPEDADDLVQEVFVTFLDGLDRFEGRSAIGTWLHGILINKARERRRSAARDDRHEAFDETFEALFDARGSWREPFPDPDELLRAREAGDAIRECLGDLPDSQREVFVLRQMQGLSAAEACNVLGRTVTHIGVLLHRARLTLRTCLGKRGWTGTS